VDHAFCFGEVRKKAVKEWSADEVKSVLNILDMYDVDNSGNIDAVELNKLCLDLGVEGNTEEVMNNADGTNFTKTEFFVWYSGCTAEEAALLIDQHGGLLQTEGL
jgi:hypothetical protein